MNVPADLTPVFHGAQRVLRIGFEIYYGPARFIFKRKVDDGVEHRAICGLNDNRQFTVYSWRLPSKIHKRMLQSRFNRGCSYEDVVAFVNRTPLPTPGRQLLKVYFSAFVARQSIDLDDARALWAELPLRDCDGPRRIPGHPAFVMVGMK